MRSQARTSRMLLAAFGTAGLLSLGAPALAQTGEVTFAVVNSNGSVYDLSMFIHQTGSTAWKLGMASFVFTYDTTAVDFASELEQGPWDNDRFPASYDNQTSVRYYSRAGRSVEIEFIGANGSGVFISSLPQLASTLRFSVKDPLKDPRVKWSPAASFITDDQGIDRTGAMTFLDLPSDVKSDGGEIPQVFELKQNYPNPFNPSTMIKYGVPQSGLVVLEVYNIVGERVATLINEHQAAGSYTAQFNAAGLPSGMYFYRLSSVSGTETRKMMLMK
jgi:hypothetical protein